MYTDKTDAIKRARYVPGVRDVLKKYFQNILYFVTIISKRLWWTWFGPTFCWTRKNIEKKKTEIRTILFSFSTTTRRKLKWTETYFQNKCWTVDGVVFDVLSTSGFLHIPFEKDGVQRGSFVVSQWVYYGDFQTTAVEVYESDLRAHSNRLKFKERY